ncbi:MAG: hypothetical protein CM15mP111_2040 [Hyphomicrobiales bacterium]|nr:MAG: hypothetical protein CM15mP111_2040 [Hyphomicrobiales bacterium]
MKTAEAEEWERRQNEFNEKGNFHTSTDVDEEIAQLFCFRGLLSIEDFFFVETSEISSRVLMMIVRNSIASENIFIEEEGGKNRAKRKELGVPK